MSKTIQRLLIFSLCFVYMLFGYQVVSAEELPTNNTSTYDISYDELNPVDYAESNAKLIELGRAQSNTRAFRQLSLTHYYQDGQTWSNDIMLSAGLPISNNGCCLVSFAMIADYYGSGDDPGEVNTTLGSSACPFSYVDAASKYNLEIVNYERGSVSTADAAAFIIGSIVEGRPVLVGMVKSNGDTHFVTAYGYRGSITTGATSTIYIYDPCAAWNYTTLAACVNAGYSVNRLYSYGE